MDRDAAAKAIDSFLRALDRDPDQDPDLVGTPDRVARAFIEELLSGYSVDVDGLLVQSLMRGHADVVAIRDIPISAMCPHHLMPSSGFAVVAFAPRSTIVGIGAVSRVVDAYAKRLALQEQIGEDVVHVLDKHVAPRWVACRIVLSHSCMRMTGGRSHDGPVETLAMVGDESDRETAYLAVGFGH